jgi:hypothetical protein
MRFLISTALLLVTSDGTFASEVPRLQIEASCRAAPRLLPQDADPYAKCMSDERAARSDLERRWASFNPEHRQICVAETGLDGTPSYVEVLTCLQMYAGGGSSPPRARRP